MSGVPSHHVLVVLYVAFRAFLRVFRAVRPVVFITPSELRAIVATALEEGALSAEERLRKEFRRELDARDRESEAVANPQSTAWVRVAPLVDDGLRLPVAGVELHPRSPLHFTCHRTFDLRHGRLLLSTPSPGVVARFLYGAGCVWFCMSRRDVPFANPTVLKRN